MAEKYLITDTKKEFGTPFTTRDGRIALYYGSDDKDIDNHYLRRHAFIVKIPLDRQFESPFIWCNDFGHTNEHFNGEWFKESPDDIISVNEKKLDKKLMNKLAKEYHDKIIKENPAAEAYGLDAAYMVGYENGFKK